MLGQEIPDFSKEVDLLLPKIMRIFSAEMDIDDDSPLYLFTWSPNPDEIPDSDFNTQHMFCLPFISDFLKTVQCGIACVEASQMARPHYHGWYQLSVDSIKEKYRAVHVKTMQRFGNLKITKSKGHYKINSYVKQANCLYYYKKDMLQSMAHIEMNPIISTDMVLLDWAQHWNLFTKKGRESVADIEDRVNLRDFYKQFYENSL